MMVMTVMVFVAGCKHWLLVIIVYVCNISYVLLTAYIISADDGYDGIGICGWLLTAVSWGLVAVTLPFSLCVCFKVIFIIG
jgi:hypothetical protein